MTNAEVTRLKKFKRLCTSIP